jgi:hypothetical protein
MPTRPPIKSLFVEALGHLDATNAPGMPISVEAVAAAAGLERTDAIRVALELIDAGWIAGVPLPGDDEIKTINGLELRGPGRRELGRQRGLQFMLELEADSRGDPDADVDAATIGQRLGWTRTEADNVATTLADSGLIEYVEMGSDLVTMTTAGRRQLDRALDNDTSPGQQLAPIVVIGSVTNSQMQVATVGSTQHQAINISDQRAQIVEFVTELRRQLPALGLDDDDRAAAEADLAAVDAQLASPRSNEGVLREALRTLRALAEGVAGNAAFAGLVELSRHLHL